MFEEKVLVLFILLAQAYAIFFIALPPFIREISKIYFQANEITFNRVRDQHINGKEIIKTLQSEIKSRSERESWLRRIEHDYEQYQTRGKLISSFSDLKKAILAIVTSSIIFSGVVNNLTPLMIGDATVFFYSLLVPTNWSYEDLKEVKFLLQESLQTGNKESEEKEPDH